MGNESSKLENRWSEMKGKDDLPPAYTTMASSQTHASSHPEKDLEAGPLSPVPAKAILTQDEAIKRIAAVHDANIGRKLEIEGLITSIGGDIILSPGEEGDGGLSYAMGDIEEELHALCKDVKKPKIISEALLQEVEEVIEAFESVTGRVDKMCRQLRESSRIAKGRYQEKQKCPAGYVIFEAKCEAQRVPALVGRSKVLRVDLGREERRRVASLR